MKESISPQERILLAVIIFSGFDEFEYAKQAIRLLCEFLLRPPSRVPYPGYGQITGQASLRT